MSRRSAVIILIVFLLLLGVIAAAALSNNQGEGAEASPSPRLQVSPSPLAGTSPSPEAVVVNGEVLSVSTSPVGFMNSRIIRVQEASGITQIYVTEETQIQNSRGTMVTLNSLRIGDVVRVTGESAEGGVLADQITVSQAAATPTPTPTPSPSPTPPQVEE